MTIRLRITIWSIIIILLANAILFTVNVRHIQKVLLDEVQTRVRLDLNSARWVYNHHIKDIENYVSTTSIRESIIANMADENGLHKVMETLRKEGEMEMLTLCSPDGTVLYRAHNPEKKGDSLQQNLFIANVLKNKKNCSGTAIIPSVLLQQDGEDIAERARFTVRYTPGQRLTPKKEETNGMVIGSAVPLFNRDTPDQIVAILYGSTLLNRRYDFVDFIRDEVFRNQVYEDKPIGMATIFQEDLRISTNVETEDGKRAVGTLLSKEVYDQVIIKGEVWSNRAFVVNNWYITAYEPIYDPEGKIVGALFLGLLEEPFKQPGQIIFIGFLMVIILTTSATLVVLYFSTLLILRPISQVISMANKVIQGDLTARTHMHPPGEMGRLCQAINKMADAVYQREEQLKDVTRQQIGQSEKLASIGRLAAGIAHEINNPLTGVLTFAHLLHEKKSMTDEDRDDLHVIIRETTRVREIVRGLLDFARESVSEKKNLNLNEVIEQTTRLVQSQKEFKKIQIILNLQSNLTPVSGDKNQLQQVLLNLSLNACEAMPDGGTLTLSTYQDDDGVILSVADTGHGIERGVIEKIFDPFFTTKPVGKGTGLGLSVTYGIIQNHGGKINVISEEGIGTTFTVFLPKVQAEAETEQ